MKQLMKNPFFWTTIVLACVLCALCGYQHWRFHVPYVVTLDRSTMTDEDIPEYWLGVFDVEQELRAGENYTSPDVAVERNDVKAMRTILHGTDLRREMLITKDMPSLLVYDPNAQKYYFLFQSKNNGECTFRVRIDAKTFGIEEEALIY